MTLTETQKGILLQALKDRDKAKSEYAKSSTNVELIVSLITGEKSNGNWEYKDGELIINKEPIEN